MSNPYESPRAASPPAPPRMSKCTTCPHCGAAAMGFWKKSRVGPIKSHNCESCGKGVGVSWRWALFSAGIGMTPAALLIVFLNIVPLRADQFEAVIKGYGIVASIAVGLAAALLCGAVQTAVLTFAAPLIKR